MTVDGSPSQPNETRASGFSGYFHEPVPQVAVCHSCNVVSDDSVEIFLRQSRMRANSQQCRVGKKSSKDGLHLPTGLVIGSLNLGMVVEVGVEMTPECGGAGFQFRRVTYKPRGMAAQLLDRGDTGLTNCFAGRDHEVLNLAVDKASDDEFAAGAGTR